jgi:hypothetical protein
MRLLLADLRRRLGPACRDWSEEAFESLILEIAHRKARWGDAASGPGDGAASSARRPQGDA